MLHITDAFTGGGVEQFVEGLTTSMAKNSNNISWLALFEPENNFDYNNCIKKIGLEQNKSVLNLRDLKLTLYQIQSELEKFKDEIIVIHSAWQVNLILPCITRNRPTVVVVHNANKHISKLCAYRHEYIDLFICVSDLSFEAFTQRYPFLANKTKVVENGISLPAVDVLAPHGSRPKSVAMVGRLEQAQKNIFGAAKVLSDVRCGFTLEIVGDGPDRDEFLNLLQEYGIEYNFHGWGDNNMVRNILLRSRVFFQPSFFEGFSIALIEAVCFGLYPVVSRLEGSNDFIEKHGFGKCLEIQNIEGMSRSIEQGLEEFSNDYSSRVSLAHEKFDIDHVAKKYFSCIEKVQIIRKPKSKTKLVLPLSCHLRLHNQLFYSWKRLLKLLLNYFVGYRK